MTQPSTNFISAPRSPGSYMAQTGQNDDNKRYYTDDNPFSSVKSVPAGFPSRTIAGHTRMSLLQRAFQASRGIPTSPLTITSQQRPASASPAGRSPHKTPRKGKKGSKSPVRRPQSAPAKRAVSRANTTTSGTGASHTGGDRAMVTPTKSNITAPRPRSAGPTGAARAVYQPGSTTSTRMSPASGKKGRARPASAGPRGGRAGSAPRSISAMTASQNTATRPVSAGGSRAKSPRDQYTKNGVAPLTPTSPRGSPGTNPLSKSGSRGKLSSSPSHSRLTRSGSKPKLNRSSSKPKLNSSGKKVLRGAINTSPNLEDHVTPDRLGSEVARVLRFAHAPSIVSSEKTEEVTLGSRLPAGATMSNSTGLDAVVRRRPQVSIAPEGAKALEGDRPSEIANRHKAFEWDPPADTTSPKPKLGQRPGSAVGRDRGTRAALGQRGPAQSARDERQDGKPDPYSEAIAAITGERKRAWKAGLSPDASDSEDSSCGDPVHNATNLRSTMTWGDAQEISAALLAGSGQLGYAIDHAVEAAIPTVELSSDSSDEPLGYGHNGARGVATSGMQSTPPRAGVPRYT